MGQKTNRGRATEDHFAGDRVRRLFLFHKDDRDDFATGRLRLHNTTGGHIDKQHQPGDRTIAWREEQWRTAAGQVRPNVLEKEIGLSLPDLRARLQPRLSIISVFSIKSLELS